MSGPGHSSSIVLDYDVGSPIDDVTAGFTFRHELLPSTNDSWWNSALRYKQTASSMPPEVSVIAKQHHIGAAVRPEGYLHAPAYHAMLRAAR